MSYSNDIAQYSDMDLRRFGADELIRKLRICDKERIQALHEHKNLMADLNRRMQIHLMEIRGMKEVNQRLQDDNQELRDLCCFLDDDRQKGRKLAREWQKFGRYTSSVMKSEVQQYQDKLRDLESRQEQMLKENLELKELCLYLDHESQGSGDRDAGDGSSNTTPTEEKAVDEADATLRSSHLTNSQGSASTSLNEDTLNYIRHLEDRISQLVESQQVRTPEPLGDTPEPLTEYHGKFFPTPKPAKTESRIRYLPPAGPRTVPGADSSQPHPQASTSKPEAVVHAMKVLEVHEQLERPLHEVTEDGELDENEKAIVREMCNVVWRKLGDYVPGYK